MHDKLHDKNERKNKVKEIRIKSRNCQVSYICQGDMKEGEESELV